MERIHKLNYLSSAESSEEIIFPRVKRRLLQLKKETESTLSTPQLNEVETCILTAKMEAITRANWCGIYLDQYGDEFLLFPGNEKIINAAAENDFKEESIQEETNIQQNVVLPADDVITIEEDLNLIRSKSNFPSYLPSNT